MILTKDSRVPTFRWLASQSVELRSVIAFPDAFHESNILFQVFEEQHQAADKTRFRPYIKGKQRNLEGEKGAVELFSRGKVIGRSLPKFLLKTPGEIGG